MHPLPTTSVLTPSYLIHTSFIPSPICFFHFSLAWEHFQHLVGLQNPNVDLQSLQFIPGNSFGLPSGIGLRLANGGWVAICEIPSVAEGMGHDEGWVQGMVSRGEVRREGGEGGEVEGRGRGGEMREVESVGGQKTVLDNENRAGGVATSVSQTAFPISQQQEPTIKAYGAPSAPDLHFSSPISTSLSSTSPGQQQAPTHGALRSSTGLGLPFSSLPPGLPLETSAMEVQQQAATNGAFGSFANGSTSFSNAPQQSKTFNVPNDAPTPGTYMGPDGRVRKMPTKRTQENKSRKLRSH